MRVSWWEEDGVWADGTIRAFDDVMGEHLVAYDDGDQVPRCWTSAGALLRDWWLRLWLLVCASRIARSLQTMLCCAPLLWCPQVEDGP